VGQVLPQGHRIGRHAFERRIARAVGTQRGGQMFEDRSLERRERWHRLGQEAIRARLGAGRAEASRSAPDVPSRMGTRVLRVPHGADEVEARAVRQPRSMIATEGR
jgi:hypothetical protein